MATSPTSSASTSTATTYFNGSSTYSAALQQVISRTVAFGQLPITLLQNQQTDLTSQQTELQAVSSQFSSLQTALDSIDSSVGSNSFAATSSAPTVATAAVSSGAESGTYTVTVASVGSQTNTVSANGLTTVTDPSSGDVSTSTAFTLTVGSNTYQISNSANTLSGLAQAINASGADVQATVVNVGGSASPDYRLSIQGTDYAATAIQLNDGSQDLLTNLSTGSPVTYQVNGQPSTPVSSTSRSLAISPGVTVNVLAVGSTSVSVAQDASAIESALSSFATAYNSTVDELAKNRGQNGGPLTGQTVISQLSNTLNSIGSYSATGSNGSINSLADLGLTFDTTGHLQFDSSTFSSATATSLSSAISFLGSEGGGGFLQTAETELLSASDPFTGTIAEENQSISDSLTTLSTKITSDQTKLSALQTTLTNQLAQADAAIAELQSQLNQVTSLFSAEQQQQANISGNG
jgi:flagellar hook-associated protein 2